MRRFLLSLLLFLLPLCGRAQQGNTVTVFGAGAPAGTCPSAIFRYVDLTTPAEYACDPPSWFLASGGGGASPLTTKGDLYTFSTMDTRLPVGANGLCLTADSAQTTGLLWTSCGSGAAHNLLSATHSDTLTASPVLGDITHGNATPAWARLAGNITTAKQFLTQTGTGAVSAVPVWGTIADADVPASLSRDTESPAAGDITGSLSAGYQIGAGAVTDAEVNASGITTRSKLPAVLAYEDEANVFTLAGGLTLDNQLGVRLRELTANGTNYIEHRAVANAGAGNTVYDWPVTTDSRFLFSGTSGALSWNQASGVGTCTNQAVTATINNAGPTCTTLTSAYTSGTFPATAHNLLSSTHGDTAAGTVVLGDVVFGNSTPAWARLAGNTTTTKQFLSQTGNGSISAAPAWAQPAFADLSGSATAGQVPNLESLNGTLDVPSGGTGAAPGGDDQVPTSDSTSAATWRTIPNCVTNNMLTYTQATNTWGCDADDGAGGGAPVGVQYIVGGTDPTLTAEKVLTDGSGIDTVLAGGDGGTATIHWTGPLTQAVSIASDAVGETVILSFEAAYTTGQYLLIRQQTGNTTGGTLLDVRAADAQTTVFRAGDGTNGITVSQAGALTAEGSGAITATLGDTATAFFGAGTLEDARLSANVVSENQANTYSTGAQDFTSATSLTVPVSAGAGPTASGQIAYDSTANALEYGDNTVNRTVANLDEAQTLSGPKTLTAPVIVDFTAAAHDHGDADDGGALVVAALPAFVVEIVMIAAGCDNATASKGLDTPTANAPTATCFGTAPDRFAYLDFADGASALTASGHFRLPVGWTGTIDLDGYSACSLATCSTNNISWNLQTVCVADGEDFLNPTYNALQEIVDAGLATLHLRNRFTQTGVTTTTCAAGETFFFQLNRDPTDASDTGANTQGLLELVWKLRRTPQS